MMFLNAAMVTILAVQLIALIYVLRVRRRQKREQDAIVAELRGARFWRIAMSQTDQAERGWNVNLNPIQALGVLIDAGEQLRLRGRWRTSSQPFDIAFAKKSASVSWDAKAPAFTGNLAWVRVRHPAGDFLLAADTGLNAANSREALADLVRNAFPDSQLPANAGADFALDKNRRSLAAVALFFLLLAFAALDTFVFSDYELVDAQIVGLLLDPFVLVPGSLLFATLAMVAYRLLVAGKVPARESLALAALLLGAAAFATLPALKRVDRALTADLSSDYKYTVVDKVVTLAPVDKKRGLPRLRFMQAPEYWAQFPVGSEVTIPLVRGPLGLWQLDHARFDPPVFEFYEKKKLERK